MNQESRENPGAGYCDCHVHIVGTQQKFAQVDDRTYTAQVAKLETLKSIAAGSGVNRFVIVQPSFYGTDNTCLLESLEALGSRGRGVVALDSSNAAPNHIDSLYRAGVCGVRLNFYSTVSRAATADRIADVLHSWIERLPRSGWHIELIAGIDTLTAAAQAIADSPIPIVIDHYGLPGEATPSSDEGRRLRELAGLANVWVKLSAPYRTVANPLETHPRTEWLSALLLAAPDRCVWGSDWPHTPTKEMQHAGGKAVPYRSLDYRKVFGDFNAAISEGARARVLKDNPSRLYGFPSEL